jgi:signal peptidase complex subunit 1
MLTYCIQLIAFNAGYFTQNIVLAVQIGLAGTLLTSLVVVPPWPFFKKKPVKWLPAGSGFGASTT